MLTRPVGLSDDVLGGVLRDRWAIDIRSIEYLPVGFGSHHWKVESDGGRGWFVTVDELDARRDGESESRAAVLRRLEGALLTAHLLLASGGDYVVAPRLSETGQVLVSVSDRWAVAVFPSIDGETYDWGQSMSGADRHAIVEVIARLHRAPSSARLHARVDDFALQNRADLERAMRGGAGEAPETGPYSRRLADLLATHGGLIGSLLDAYDELVAGAHVGDERRVLTHGEPHPGNTIRTRTGWRLVDWDTVLVSVPERDLWVLEPGDGSAIAACTRATGTEIDPAMLELFRLRWDLADLGAFVAWFRSPHGTTEDDMKSWNGLTTVLSRHLR